MPIRRIEKQLDERGVLGNLPRFGKLRKGAEKPDNRIGRDLDYLRLTLEPEYEEKIRPAFERLFGKEPTELHNVLIAADSAATAFDYWYEEWAHAKLVKRCDGDEIVLSWNEAEQRSDDTHYECTCDPLNRACSQKGTMDIVIPGLCEATGLWGTLTLLTSSIYDVVALAGYMRVAGAFMLKIPQIAFWSVPFTIGRAMRKVPVTINGKRSIKPMSLLYAQIEPDFNQQVLSPMLMKPAQLLLAGVNPDTGELPDFEVTLEQTQMWDRDYVNAQTLHLFDHENHQANAIDKLIADGTLTDDLSDLEAVQGIMVNREQRAAEKASKNTSESHEDASNSSAAQSSAQIDLDWVNDAKTVGNFVKQAHQKLNLNTGQIMEALRHISPQPIGLIQNFVGSKADAWAACIALKCNYDPDQVAGYLESDTSGLRERVLEIIEKQDIPF